MHKVTIGNRQIEAEDGQLLSELFIRCGIAAEHPCGGMGVCKKCRVTVNDAEELSCRYRIHSDITVVLPEHGEILSETGVEQFDAGSLTETETDAEKAAGTAPLCLVLDIGTTTLALAAVDLSDKKVVKVLTSTNPQRVFGADVISRIEYCRKNSVEPLQEALVSEINRLVRQLSETIREDFGCAGGMLPIKELYVAGNATMLHTLFGEDCSSLGVAPYTPVFLEKREMTAVELGIFGVERIISLPSVSTFVGADIVAGLNYVGLPQKDTYDLFVDLGTNAEVVLFSGDVALCTAAAAGPCFEGANISCGMSATLGAVAGFSLDADGKPVTETIGGAEPKGICGTGLVDVIAALCEAGEIDETGYMECEEYLVADGVILTQGDIRQYQLAKSAVCSAIQALVKVQGISYEQIGKLYISGGFSAKINTENAVKTGLLPKELLLKCVAIGNSSLLGTIRFAMEHNDLSVYLKNAKYVDLAADKYFAELFMENMEFES